MAYDKFNLLVGFGGLGEIQTQCELPEPARYRKATNRADLLLMNLRMALVFFKIKKAMLLILS